MREINDAWALLSDPDRRRRYDATLDPYDAGPVVGGARTVPSDSWHPRQDDTGWMDDFEAWRQETDDAVPAGPAQRRPQHPHDLPGRVVPGLRRDRLPGDGAPVAVAPGRSRSSVSPSPR